MRRREPLNVDESWQHSLPMPMPNQPVCATELDVKEQLDKLSINPRVFLWTDSERRCTQGWEFLASVRQGVPPQGIEAELIAFLAARTINNLPITFPSTTGVNCPIVGGKIYKFR